MAESYSSKLQLWEGWVPALVHGLPIIERGRQVAPQAEFAERLFLEETWHRRRTREFPEPFSLQWFLDVENTRHGRQGHWIPRLLEFARHNGETLLGVGNVLGTDWVQYARHGAQVVACSASAQHLSLTQRNFELRGLRGKFHHTSPAALPVESASIDVACLVGWLGEMVDPAVVVAEVFRVLKPGGKVLAVAPAKYDIDYWCRDWLPWRGTLRARPPGPARPTVCYSARRLRRLFAPFTEHRVYKRLLRRAEVPYLWRCLPLPLLERMVGRLLILKAFKPLSTAITANVAA
jgi:SAM-dependent methyltransferase